MADWKETSIRQQELWSIYLSVHPQEEFISWDEWLYKAGQESRDEEIANLRAKIEEYNAQSTLTYCVYCGATFPLDDDAGTKVTEHIQSCEKHPLFQAKHEIADLKRDYQEAKDVFNDYVQRYDTKLAEAVKEAEKQGMRKVIPIVDKLFEALSHADFSNGNEAFGMDEGRVRGYEFVKTIEDDWQSFLKNEGLEVK